MRRAGIVLLVLLGLTAGAADRTAGAVSFYDVPDNLVRFRVGDLVKWEPAGNLPSELNGIVAMRIMYRSSDARRRPIAVTGMVFMPAHGVPPASGWPIVSFTHGTTGVGDLCAPSRHPDLYWNIYAWFVARLVRDGFVVAATDYEGLGTPGLHPWLELDSEARAATDVVTATRQLLPQASSAWAVVGHSQGGHAALGTGELALSRPVKGLTYVGAVSIAPGSHLVTLAPLADSPEAGWDLLAYVAASIRASEPGFDYAELLVPPLLTEMPRAEVTCVAELFRYLSTTYPSGLRGLRPDWQEQETVARWFTRNEPGQRPSGAPILLLQGANDAIVPAVITTNLAARLCANGDVVAYRVFAGADHDVVLRQGYDTVADWLRRRFAGEPAPSTCHE